MRTQRAVKCAVSNSCTRAGYLYISVMVTAFTVSFVGLAGLTAARLALRSTTSEFDRLQAELLARAAIEYATAELQQHAEWQNVYEFNVEYPSPVVSVNGGTFTWRLLQLSDGTRRLDGIGRRGQAAAVFSVELNPAEPPALDCAVLCAGDLTIGRGTTTESLALTGAHASTNAGLINLGTITGDVEAQSQSGSGTVIGTVTVPGRVRELPDPANVFDYYLQQGTTIETSLLDDGTGNIEIRRALLSPDSNPYGSPNPEGIYIIRCEGRPFSVSDSRIVGTLVILDPDPADPAQIKREVNWEPAIPHYPAALVRGSLSVRVTDLHLSESVLGVNLNPDTTPYQGRYDTLLDDEYPSALGGLFYATGDVIFDGINQNSRRNLHGLVICGGGCTLARSANILIRYDATPAGNPPPGFRGAAENTIVPGTWRRTASD